MEKYIQYKIIQLLLFLFCFVYLYCVGIRNYDEDYNKRLQHIKFCNNNHNRKYTLILIYFPIFSMNNIYNIHK